ncbi:16S rRNA (uracil(1498)-N(3))-methyltransferase [Clostridium grantii]|uniref:Ribosomal RNA small subunit methyltransferase E n=1 Tax=Clostridium grantii DSM 8605 TaxID=1121316 RepID=A0A1M5XLG1_9CLOT|nr:16S rRNA (uracil(1498)-N(3))-methyltransferase [Clostridium grantii]SHI00388.1 16S rRNA (uracil1498-N3)-methyltransferase [Clostridium grantii DSM 8605]
MHKFFVDKSCFYDDCAEITGDDVKHIFKVLRLKEDDKVVINDCKGKEFLAIIKDINKQRILVDIEEEILDSRESALEVYLFQGLPKAAKMELIIQKTTELGVKEVIPVVTKRVLSSIKNIEGECKKLDRWNKIALEACKQSKRSVIPTIREITYFESVLKDLKGMDLVLVPYENAENYGIKKVVIDKCKGRDIKKIAILIGPEGGFEEEEIEILKDLNCEIVTLGPRILRTETAGMVAMSLIMYELGDIGGNV